MVLPFFKSTFSHPNSIKIDNTKISDWDEAGLNTLLQYLQTNLPDILYYDDFIFEIPEEIIFSVEDSQQNLFPNNPDREKLNREWQEILRDVQSSLNTEQKKKKQKSREY